MIKSFNPQDLLSGIKTLIDADSTLQNSNHLTGSGRAWTNRAPNDADMPFLVITCLPMVPDDMQQYSTEVRITNYTDLLTNGQIDSAGDRISARCEEILNNSQPTLSGGVVKPLVSLGIVSAFIDPLDASRATGVLRLRVYAGKTG